MGMVIKISGREEPDAIRKALETLLEVRRKKKPVLADFYGALPYAYEDGLIYQQKQRNEWQ
jgi:hypothetical protein